jgi:hypothetical protein
MKTKCPFCAIGVYNRKIMFRLVGRLSRKQLKDLREEFIKRGLIIKWRKKKEKN